ncbi:MAG: hypothetical protein HKN57_03400 [Xanthomonadales bacterium]|nr:hypothetical protein [Gammaproteobacteria bacterium]MBT8054539.1 hypothetical protein [Gammaproteobacteria bacterium]NND56274.1 hypothetical protein [Xanthomonadales bacterium]NNK52350.1 hypothetical protein [Xanthomonadales bacterium]
MNAKLKTLVPEEAAVDSRSFDRIVSDKNADISSALNGEKVVNDSSMHEAPTKKRTLAKTIGMAIAAPLLALAYVIALPLIGLYYMAKFGLEAFAKKLPVENRKLKNAATLLKNIGLFLVAPFIALGYVIALPFAGLVMFTKLANEARANRG